MGTIMLWVVIAILFVSNPALFFLGGIGFLVYQGFKHQQPNKFTANPAGSPGSDQKGEEQTQTHTREDLGRFKFKNEDDPEVVELRDSIQNHINRNRAQADEDLLAEAEREYAAKKRAEELGLAN